MSLPRCTGCKHLALLHNDRHGCFRKLGPGKYCSCGIKRRDISKPKRKKKR